MLISKVLLGYKQNIIDINKALQEQLVEDDEKPFSRLGSLATFSYFIEIKFRGFRVFWPNPRI